MLRSAEDRRRGSGFDDRPSRITRTSSATAATARRSCETNSIASPAPAAAARAARGRDRTDGSSADTGSSSTRMSGARRERAGDGGPLTLSTGKLRRSPPRQAPVRARPPRATRRRVAAAARPGARATRPTRSASSRERPIVQRGSKAPSGFWWTSWIGSQRPARGFRCGVPVVAECHRPGVGRLDAQQQAREGRLARPGFADDAEGAAARSARGDVLTAGPPKALAQRAAESTTAPASDSRGAVSRAAVASAMRPRVPRVGVLRRVETCAAVPSSTTRPAHDE